MTEEDSILFDSVAWFFEEEYPIKTNHNGEVEYHFSISHTNLRTIRNLLKGDIL